MKISYQVFNRPSSGLRRVNARGRISGRYIHTAVMILLAVGIQHVRAQDVKINNNMVIEADGTMRLDNAATVWNDLMVFPDATTKGGSNPPEWGTALMKNAGGTSKGVYLWMFASNQEEELHFTVQLPHDYKVGTDIHPHVHWTTVAGIPSATNVVWGLEYTLVAVGGSFPKTVTILANSLIPECSPPASTGQHLISPFSPVSGAGLGISSILVCRLFRATGDVSDTFPNAVGLLGFDIHYEQDTQGSRDQWMK